MIFTGEINEGKEGIDDSPQHRARVHFAGHGEN